MAGDPTTSRQPAPRETSWDAWTASTSAVDEIASRLALAEQQLGRLSDERDLWRQGYAGLATSRLVRIGDGLLSTLHRLRIGPGVPRLRDPDARAARVEEIVGRRRYEPSAAAPPPFRTLPHRPREGEDRVRIGLATMPSRTDGLLRVIERLYDQADELCVYLNGFTEVPETIRGDSRIHAYTGPDLGDRGKFWFLTGFTGYYLTVDDDIEYPPFYVDHMIDGIERYRRRAIVGWHGSVLHPGPEDYYAPGARDIINFSQDCPQDTPVHVLGTGCMAFHSSTMDLSFEVFDQSNVADLLLAIEGQRHGVPFIVLAHAANWAKPLALSNPQSIFGASRWAKPSAFNMRDRASALVKSWPSWQLATAPEPDLRPQVRLAVLRPESGAEAGGSRAGAVAAVIERFGSPFREFRLDEPEALHLDGWDPAVVLVEVPPQGAAQPGPLPATEQAARAHLEAGRVVVLVPGHDAAHHGPNSAPHWLAGMIRELQRVHPGRVLLAQGAGPYPCEAEWAGLEHCAIRLLPAEVPSSVGLTRCAFDTSSGVLIIPGQGSALPDGDPWSLSRSADTLGQALSGVAPPGVALSALADPDGAADPSRPDGLSLTPREHDLARQLSRFRLVVALPPGPPGDLVWSAAAAGVPVIQVASGSGHGARTDCSALAVAADDVPGLVATVYSDRGLWRRLSARSLAVVRNEMATATGIGSYLAVVGLAGRARAAAPE